MSNNKLRSALLTTALFGACTSVIAAETTIEINNDTSSSEALISSSVTGSLSPSAPSTLNSNDSVNLVSSTYGTIDAGAIRYQSCRFNWSVMRLGSFYQFTIGAEPARDCTATVMSQNAWTGEYSVMFDIDQ